MTKLGTPIGAAPKSAIVTLGLVSVGEPSGLRSASGFIGARVPPLFPPPSRSRSRSRSRPGFDSPLSVSPPTPRPPSPVGPTAPPGPVLPVSGSSVVVSGLVVVVSGEVVVGCSGVVVVVEEGGVGVPLVPDSEASSGPVQSGSAMSVIPSPSSSAVFEH